MLAQLVDHLADTRNVVVGTANKSDRSVYHSKYIRAQALPRVLS